MFLTQNTSQRNVLFTSFKVLLFHILCQWFSRWFGLWFQGNNLIQGKNLRGSFVNVLNLSLSAGNIFKASIDTALNLGKSFWLKYLEPVRKFWVKGILSQKVLSLKYHILDNNGAFNLSSEKYANVSTAKKHICTLHIYCNHMYIFGSLGRLLWGLTIMRKSQCNVPNNLLIFPD